MLTCVSSGGHLMGTSLRSFTRTIQHYMKMTLTYWNGKTQWKDELCGWGKKSTNKRVGWTSDQFSKTTHQCKLYYSQFINFVFKFLFCLLRKYTTHTTNTYAHYIVILIVPLNVEYILCVLLRCVFEFIYKDWARFWRVTVFPSKPQSNPISSGLDWIVFHCHLHRF